MKGDFNGLEPEERKIEKKVRFKIQDTKEHVETTSVDKQVESIEFQTMSSQDIQKLAELEVINSRFYNNDEAPEGVAFAATKDGLLDPRMGVSSKHEICETCQEKYDKCPGHYGYIKLELPVYHVGFFKHVLQILQCICKTCSEVLLTEASKKEYLARKVRITDPIEREKIRRDMINECKGQKLCLHCEAYNGTVKKEPKIACKHHTSLSRFNIF